LGGRNITLIIAVLFGYVFGSTAWAQSGEAPTGVRVAFALAFVLAGFGVPWLVYFLLKLLSRLLGRSRDA
jgi:hypothetical protein